MVHLEPIFTAVSSQLQHICITAAKTSQHSCNTFTTNPHHEKLQYSRVTQLLTQNISRLRKTQLTGNQHGVTQQVTQETTSRTVVMCACCARHRCRHRNTSPLPFPKPSESISIAASRYLQAVAMPTPRMTSPCCLTHWDHMEIRPNISRA